MGREADIVGKGAFSWRGGVKKVIAKAGWEFLGRGVGVSWGVRGILRGKGLFRGGVG